MYCCSKSNKTTQCTLHIDTSAERAWDQNLRRDENQQYSQEIFDALVMRYEAPDGRNRWDAPLFTIQPEDELPFVDIAAALFERKAPPPNQSTQSVSNINFFFPFKRNNQFLFLLVIIFSFLSPPQIFFMSWTVSLKRLSM